jgi:hypothetical protein
MMYRTIDTGTWGDPWFEELTPPGKLLFLYLITNNRTSMSGAYPITLRTMANETCLSQERVSDLLRTFGDRVEWWPDLSCIFIKNFYKHQRANSSEKYRVGAVKQMLDLPDVVRESVCIAYPELRTFPIPIAYPINTPSTEQSRTETEAKKKRAENPPTPRAGGKRPLPDPEEGFDEFYGAYPRHDDRQDAIRGWNALAKSERERAMAALPTWMASEQWQDAKYVPHASTYLNKRRFDDEVPKPTARASPNGKHPTPIRVDTAPLDSRWADVIFEVKRWQPGMETPRFDEATDRVIESLGGWQNFVRSGARREAFDKARMGVSA